VDESKLIKAPIEVVAVWDTVGSLGIPDFTVRAGRVDAFQFADTKLSSIVQHGLHAIAIDEQRGDFTPTLWNADARIVQVLFPGAHADVGGGYPKANSESGLSDCSLQWMMDELAPLGVIFVDPLACVPHPDPCGSAHQPWGDVPWNVLLRSPRRFPDGLCLARCLVSRLAGGLVVGGPGLLPSPYAPANLTGYLRDRMPLGEVRII
jgi:hypothetical protein